MTKALIRAADDAFQTFRELTDQLMKELAEHRALIDDYDTLVEQRIRAVNAGAIFLYETAASVMEATTGKTVSQVLRERGVPAPGSMVQ